MVDDCCLSCKNEKTVRDILNIVDTKMIFATEKEKGIIPFEILGVIKY